MGRKTTFIIILCMTILLLLAACEQPSKENDSQNKTKVNKTVKKTTNKTISRSPALSNRTNESREAVPQEMPRCQLVVNEIEDELAAARNVSAMRDQELFNMTNEYVIAQEDDENAQKTGNPSRITSATAKLQRAQSAWETAKGRAREMREEVKRLKLVLVKAKDDCDPTYVPPYANASVASPPFSTPLQNCDRASLRTLQDAYDGMQGNITDAEEEIDGLQDEREQLADQRDAGNAAGNADAADALQRQVEEKDALIQDLQRELPSLRQRLEERRVALNPVRIQCGFDAIRRDRDADA